MTATTRPTRRLHSVFVLTFALGALATLTGCPIFWHDHEHEDHERAREHEHFEERHEEHDHDRR